MKVVIDISENDYELACRWPDALIAVYAHAIKNGTPLPKGHGRLIDADAFIARLEDASKRQKYKKLLIDDCLTVDDVFKAIIESLQNKGLANGDTPTIIEADTDKAESNLDGDPVDIDKAVEHYEGTLETLKGIDFGGGRVSMSESEDKA